MKWFINVFMKSFSRGETRISRKQFDIFCRYIKEEFEDGYIRGVRGVVDGVRVRAYEWSSVAGCQYFVEIG